MLAGGAVALVLVVVIALVVAKVAGLGAGDDAASTTGSGGGASALASPAVVKAVTSVPASVLDEIGIGDAQTAPSRIDAPRLVADGKPKVLYVGAEFCPYCAAERWPVVVALSRFGTWSHLGATHSASKDVYPDTQTLSFHGATYTSDYLAFTGVETTGNTPVDGAYPPLDSLDRADDKVVQDYNKPPYTATAGSIPFIDVAGRYVTSGATYSPKVLAGMSRAEIAAALDDPKDPVAKAVGGTANVLTAVLCEATGGQPSEVCTAPGVTAAAEAVAGAQPK
jgi:thiol-disulfide isomerase/thioredoxin